MDRPVPPTAPPPPAAPLRRIDSDAYCRKCGYNQRGVEVDAIDTCICPECGERSTAYFLLEARRPRGINRAQWSVAAIVAAIAAFIVGYHLLNAGNLGQSAALFIGLPAVLAIMTTLAPRARSATGMIVRAMTIALLVSGMLLGEGMVCVLMMAPLFYTVGIVIGASIDLARKRDRGQVSSIRLRCWVIAPILLLALEGVTPPLSLPRSGTVSCSAVIDAAPEDVAAALAAPPRFDEPLPLYLQIGFPRPVAVEGRGLQIGDERLVHFDSFGWKGRSGYGGALRLRVAERDEGRVVFEVVSDTTKISRWMRWRASEVTWAPAGAGKTKITWRIAYERQLDPAWYFGPWQRYAVGLSADHLIKTVATPAD